MFRISAPALCVVLLCSSVIQAEEVFPGAQWSFKTPAELGVDNAKLQAGLSELPGRIVVVKSGYIIYEQGYTQQQIKLFSCSKSITAMIAASLVQDQAISNFDELVSGSGNPQASYRHFMSMTSDYGLDPHEPGAHYAYNNNAVHHYGGFMASQFFGGATPVDVLKSALLDIIGYEHEPGFTGQWGGWYGGWLLSCRDFARLGYLVLRDGQWDGQQVLAPEFIEGLYEPQIAPAATAYSNPSNPNENSKWNQQAFTDQLYGNYSYAWWKVDDWNAIAALGYQGKKLIVIPSQDIVVAVLAEVSENQDPDVHLYYDAVMEAVQLKSELHNPLAATITFEDGTLGGLESNNSSWQITDGTFKASAPTQLRATSQTYNDGSVLYRIAKNMPTGCWVGAMVRADSPQTSLTTPGPYTLVSLWHLANEKFLVRVGQYDEVTDGIVTLYNSEQFELVNWQSQSISVRVQFSGSSVQCTVNGIPMLGTNGYGPILQPIEGGYSSVVAHLSASSGNTVGLDYVLLRDANAAPDITVDANGNVWLSIVQDDLLASFAGNTFAFGYNGLAWDWDGFWTSVIPTGFTHMEGYSGDHFVLGTVGSPASDLIMPGDEFEVYYAGAAEGELIPDP